MHLKTQDMMDWIGWICEIGDCVWFICLGKGLALLNLGFDKQLHHYLSKLTREVRVYPNCLFRTCMYIWGVMVGVCVYIYIYHYICILYAPTNWTVSLIWILDDTSTSCAISGSHTRPCPVGFPFHSFQFLWVSPGLRFPLLSSKSCADGGASSSPGLLFFLLACSHTSATDWSHHPIWWSIQRLENTSDRAITQVLSPSLLP